MFSNIGWSGLVLIFIAVLIVFGPKRLPDIGKALGRSLREFRNATTNVIDSDITNVAQTPPTETARPRSSETQQPIANTDVTPSAAFGDDVQIRADE